jgi:hypothetical protein
MMGLSWLATVGLAWLCADLGRIRVPLLVMRGKPALPSLSPLRSIPIPHQHEASGLPRPEIKKPGTPCNGIVLAGGCWAGLDFGSLEKRFDYNRSPRPVKEKTVSGREGFDSSAAVSLAMCRPWMPVRLHERQRGHIGVSANHVRGFGRFMLQKTESIALSPLLVVTVQKPANTP